VTRSIVTAVALASLSLGACSDAAEPTATAPNVTFATLPAATSAPTEPQVSGTVSSDVTESTQVAVGPTATTSPAATTPAPPLGDPSVNLVQFSGAEQPVDIAWRAGDVTAFVVGLPGRVVPMRDGVTGSPVLDITDLTSTGGEQGLLGLTFSTDGSKAYINYTDNDGDTVIAEYAVAADGTFDENTRRELLTIDQPYENHNGGNVTIGPDSMLYIGMGDGGSGGDPQRFALNVASLLGKILRIDPTAAPDGESYSVPADNPFVGVPGAQPEIWSVGVRNPWRMSFDSATGDLWFGDVGQNELEEVDVAWADQGGGRGLNFGWSAFEATARFNTDQSPEGATPPIYEYPHGDDTGCSITGGAMYRGAAIPELVGWYVFGDYCSGNISALRIVDRALVDTVLLGSRPGVTAIREGSDGELVVLAADGSISAIVSA
jgi:glucose/arabinose dehydrogenase